MQSIEHYFVQYFTRFQVTVCARGPSALAELLVSLLCSPMLLWECMYICQSIHGRLYYMCHFILLPRDAMLARYMLSLCVCPSVTSRSATKMAKSRITQRTPYDSQGL